MAVRSSTKGDGVSYMVHRIFSSGSYW